MYPEQQTKCCEPGGIWYPLNNIFKLLVSACMILASVDKDNGVTTSRKDLLLRFTLRAHCILSFCISSCFPFLFRGQILSSYRVGFLSLLIFNLFMA